MTNKHLVTFLSLVLIFGMVSPVLSYTVDAETSVESRPVQVQSQVRVRMDNDLGTTTVEVQEAQLQEQRERIRVEAEARRVAAQERGDEARAKREAMKLEIEARWAKQDEQREAARVQAESKRAESMAKRVEFQQKAAERRVENVTRVISATIERLEQIIVRIESRIAKIKAQGGDTTESEKSVSAARENLSDARLVVDTFVLIDLSSNDAQENFERIRVAAATVRELIRVAHQNLMMAVRSLRSMEITLEADVSVE